MLNPIKTAGAAIVRGSGVGPVHDVLGVTHVYKALAQETDGAISVWEAAVPPGAGAPPHSHAGEAEAFYVLEGAATLEVAGETRVLDAGSFVYSPRGVAHAFRNDGDCVLRMLVMCMPGGLERMFGAMDHAARGPLAPDSATIIAIAAGHGVSIGAG